VDNRNEISDFLTSRRAKITPERAGLPAYGGRRRVSGLRREEVALLAGISVDYYTRLERGDLKGVSDSVLGYGLYSELYLDPARPVNVARFVFLAPQAHTFFIDWPTAANDIVAALRTEAGKNPHDRGLSDLVGELSTRSEEFATRWASQNVRFHRSGLKDIHHPIVGDLHLSFEVMDLPADPGLSLVIYSAEPGSASQDALYLLASWTVSDEQSTAANEPSSATAVTDRETA